MKYRLQQLFPFLWLVIALTACRQDPPLAEESVYEFPTAESPEAVGLDSEMLAAIDSTVQAQIDSVHIQGLEVLVLRQGQVAYHKSFGYSSLEDKTAMGRDDIFRLASMTKPITSVAALILLDEGHFQLDDPISKFLPEFADIQVLEEMNLETAEYTSVPAEREITFRDLFTHSSGIGYGFIQAEADILYSSKDIPDAWTLENDVLADKMKALSTVPLLHQPGEKWTYGMSIDLLGRIVEVISGQSLSNFMSSRIFEPLGMDDTYFYLPEEKADRLIPVYGINPAGELVAAAQSDSIMRERFAKGSKAEGFSDSQIDSLAEAMINFPINGAKSYYSGGGGLVGTTEDYARFGQMLTNGGELNEFRMLEATTVKLMSTNQFKEDAPFGLGVHVSPVSEGATHPDQVGAFGWGGYFGTTYFSDPSEDLTVVINGQSNPNKYLETLRGNISKMIYESIIKETEKEVVQTSQR